MAGMMTSDIGIMLRRESCEEPPKEHESRSGESGRLIVVSNRVADPESTVKAGGLAVALKDALSDVGGVWFGWNGNTTDSYPSAPETTLVDGITYATTDLSSHEYETYYQGYANQVLWPILHQRIELANFNEAFRTGYFAVNDRFAQQVRKSVAPGDVIWIYDYHLLPLGHALRRLGCEQRIGLFLHTPMPHHQYLVMMPQHRDLLRRLLSYNVIGFQSDQDCKNFIEYAAQELGAARWGDSGLRTGDRHITVKAFPIGIDVDEIRRFTQLSPFRREMQAIRQDLAGGQQIIGAERLDYSKGLPERFTAFRRLMAEHEELRGKVRLLQIASPSRSTLQPYRLLRNTIDRLSGSINSELGDEKWRPIVYVRRTVARPKLMSWFRASGVGLVTPLRDGMNLVAKEYVAAQDADDPGVLVLSEFAGAAEQMRAALLVNPYDIRATSRTLHQALRMSREERRERHSDLLSVVEQSAIHLWRARFLAELRSAVSRPAAR